MNEKEEKKLTPKEQRFVDFYTTAANFNATLAHEMAGFKAKNYDTRTSMASRLLRKVRVQEEIKRVLQKEHEENDILKTKIRRKYEKLAFLTIDKFLVFGAKPVDGSQFDQSFVVLKNMADIEPEYLDCIKKVKQTAQGYEIELYSAMDAAAELRKMYGFDQPVKHEIAGKDGGPIETENVDLIKILEKYSIEELKDFVNVTSSDK